MRILILFLVTVLAHAESPWNLQQLSQPPKAEWGEKNEMTQEVWYDGEPFAGKKTRVFAYVGRPQGAGPHPAVVLVHGGGGEAFRDWAVHWAKRGYVSIAMDTAGRGPKKGANPDAGPDQEDKTKFRTDLPDTDMWTYHAVSAAILGHSLVLSLPEVDKERTAITGISWGGYLTCIIAGVDHRFKAAVPVYGCGFLHENSAWKEQWLDKMSDENRAKWVAKWDPSSHLGNVKCPILFLNGTNDFAYPLDSYRKCYNLVPKDLRHISVIINLKHGHFWNFPEPDAFIDSVLSGKAKPARFSDVEVHGDHASALIVSEVPPVSAELCYTSDVGPWQKRKWQSVPADIKGGMVVARLPDMKPLTFYLSATDKSGVKTTSPHAGRE